MPGIFGQVFSAFQSLLSRAFWFGSFLPVALFAALNLMLAPTVFPSAPKLEDVIKADWGWMPAVLVGLVIVAYALGPLIPLFRELLDGRGLPDIVQRALIRRPEKERQRAEDDLNTARDLAASSGRAAAKREPGPAGRPRRGSRLGNHTGAVGDRPGGTRDGSACQPAGRQCRARSERYCPDVWRRNYLATLAVAPTTMPVLGGLRRLKR